MVYEDYDKELLLQPMQTSIYIRKVEAFKKVFAAGLGCHVLAQAGTSTHLIP